MIIRAEYNKILGKKRSLQESDEDATDSESPDKRSKNDEERTLHIAVNCKCLIRNKWSECIRWSRVWIKEYLLAKIAWKKWNV